MGRHCRASRQPAEPDDRIGRHDNRLNDVKTDSRGRIWAGSKDDTDQTASGALYRLDGDLIWQRMDDDSRVTNAPTFNLDGTVMYHTDSGTRTISAFDLDESGRLQIKRIWLKLDDGWGYPDGMTTDAEGFLWIAHWSGGRATRFSPDGKEMRRITLSASNITSRCFAGDKLNRLFVTSSTPGKNEERFAEALFEIDAGVRGLEPLLFAMQYGRTRQPTIHHIVHDWRRGSTIC